MEDIYHTHLIALYREYEAAVFVLRSQDRHDEIKYYQGILKGLKDATEAYLHCRTILEMKNDNEKFIEQNKNGIDRRNRRQFNS